MVFDGGSSSTKVVGSVAGPEGASVGNVCVKTDMAMYIEVES